MGSELTVSRRGVERRGVERRSVDGDGTCVAAWLHGRPQNTAAAYQREAARFLAFVAVPLPAVTLLDVQDYADMLAGSELAPGSQGRALAAVKSLLSFAHRIGYLPFNVGAAEKLPPLEFTLAQRIVDAATIRRLIEGEPNARNRTLLRLLYFGGFRRSEVAGLRWHDLQERGDDNGQATVFGKGAKTRAVVLPAHLWRELCAMRDGAEDDAPVFVSRKGGPLTSSQIWRIVKAAGARVGVPGLSPHWLRHALASHALDNGAALDVVRDTLGHASLATTSRYLHARPGDSAGLYLAAI